MAGRTETGSGLGLVCRFAISFPCQEAGNELLTSLCSFQYCLVDYKGTNICLLGVSLMLGRHAGLLSVLCTLVRGVNDTSSHTEEDASDPAAVVLPGVGRTWVDPPQSPLLQLGPFPA